jgi:hypothetical protein
MTDPPHPAPVPPSDVPPAPAAAPPPLVPPPARPPAPSASQRRSWRLWTGLGLLVLVVLVGGGALAWKAGWRPPRGPVPTPTLSPNEAQGPPFFPVPAADDTPDQPDPPLPASLAAAFEAEQEGRYADAAGLYAPVAAGDRAAAETRAARWRLALCHYAGGQYDDAIAELAAFTQDYPTDPRAVRAAFWAGQAQAAAGRPNRALDEFQS